MFRKKFFLAVVLAGLMWSSSIASAARLNSVAPSQPLHPVATVNTTPLTPEPPKQPEKPPQKKIETPPIETPVPVQAPIEPVIPDYSKCEPERYLRADNGECMDKPKPVAAAKPVATTTTPAPASGSCAEEIVKYDWNHEVALNVARQESGLRADNVNNNPATGDYSIGCFQINIYGANAASRPSEAWLKVAANNVQYAYNMWKAQGWKPWANHTCKVVACY